MRVSKRPVAAVLALGLIAGGTGIVTAQDGESAGDVRFLVAENFWADWDPYNHTAQIQRRIEAQIFDFLVDFPDTSGDPVPMLATEWTQVDDRTWDFTLREGVTFHDGSTFDAEDVKASIELASGKTLRPPPADAESTDEVPSLSAGEWVPTAVEVIDPQTARLVSDTVREPLRATAQHPDRLLRRCRRPHGPRGAAEWDRSLPARDQRGHHQDD